MLPKDLVVKFQKRGFQVQTIDSRYIFTSGDLDRKLIVEFPLQSLSDFNFGVCERLRRTFATWLTKKCQGDKTVSAEVLGQSERIEEHYVHLAEELEQQRNQVQSSREVRKVVF